MSNSAKDTTLIGANTRFTGDVNTNGDLIIEGHVEGNCVIDGTLTLSNCCHWQGNVEAHRVVVNGVVEGDIVARDRLEILPGARIVGNCISPSITIKQGAAVTGWLSRHGPAEEEKLVTIERTQRAAG